MCIYLAETLFQASNSLSKVQPTQMVPMIFSWHAWAFLTPSMLLVGIYLYDGIKISRTPRSQRLRSYTRPFTTDLVSLDPTTSFPILLSGKATMGDGIQVNRAEMVVVDQDTGKQEEKEKCSYRRNWSLHIIRLGAVFGNRYMTFTVSAKAVWRQLWVRCKWENTLRYAVRCMGWGSHPLLYILTATSIIPVSFYGFESFMMACNVSRIAIG